VVDTHPYGGRRPRVAIGSASSCLRSPCTWTPSRLRQDPWTSHRSRLRLWSAPKAPLTKPEPAGSWNARPPGITVASANSTSAPKRARGPARSGCASARSRGEPLTGPALAAQGDDHPWTRPRRTRRCSRTSATRPRRRGNPARPCWSCQSAPGTVSGPGCGPTRAATSRSTCQWSVMPQAGHPEAAKPTERW